jgi:ribonucleoside-diphosphate reductase alpha chain
MAYSLPTDYQTFIATSRYSRWRDDLGRRENWEETVSRYFDFFYNRLVDSGKMTTEIEKELEECKLAVLNLEVLPSMRALMTAGKALERDEVAGFNCSYVAIDHPHAFDEILYVLTCGTGAGFGVESEDVAKLPEVPSEFHPTDSVIVVADSKIGWATAYRELISMLYAGKIPKWDVSKIRPAGARLKTFGGRASGPDPLVRLFDFTVKVFTGAAGRKLKPIECHDIVCKVAEIVVVGGVRRSALISLSDLSDPEIRHCKSGNWWENNVQRALANNSAVYNAKPDIGQFMEEWLSLYRSGSGERGIFNRHAVKKYISELPNRDSDYRFGANPCNEIILRSAQFCNLSSVQISPKDTVDSLKRKVKVATILGTLQSSLTNFRYLRKVWKRNSEEERLLGVSFSGICDNSMMSNYKSEDLKNALSELREYAREVNKDWAGRIGIAESTAITCVKPEGCRPISAITVTDKGILTMEEFLEISDHEIGDDWSSMKSPVSVMQRSERAPVGQTYANGFSEVLEITMNYGQTVRSTPNHKWFIEKEHLGGNRIRMINDWAEAKDIKPGYVIATNTMAYRSEVPYRFRSINKHHISTHGDIQDIQQPVEMDEDLAWFLGYLWGDGCMSTGKYRLRWIDSGEDNLSKIKRILQDKFGLNSTMKSCSDRRAYTLEVGSKLLWHWLIKNHVWKYMEDGGIEFIPRCVRQSSWKHIVAFFAGLVDADGHATTDPDGVGIATWTTADERLAKHVQSTLFACGINMGRSLNSRGENHQGRKRMFLCGIGAGCRSDAFDVLLANSNKFKAVGCDTWRMTGEPNLVIGKVKSVNSVGVMPTFDIQVDGEPWYYDGAFKSHNTTSQLADRASGIHPRYSKYYIRTVRADKKDPLAIMMKDAGFPVEDDITKPDSTYVFSFPMKSPDSSILRDDMTAIDQLELWLTYKKYWADHTVSCTIYVREHEWVDVAAWVYKHFDDISGLSFLPHSNHVYKQAPYTECTKEEYEKALAAMPPSIDWSALALYERSDETTGAQEMACTAGGCELT